MPLSMTAYARSNRNLSKGSVFIEIQSVNRKFLEIIVNVPDELTFFDATIRSVIRGAISRGRVVVTMKSEWEKFPHSLKLNKGYLKELKKLWLEVKEELGDMELQMPNQWLSNDPKLLCLEIQTSFEKEVKEELEKGLQEAVDALIFSKEAEALAISKDIFKLLKEIDLEVDFIEKLAEPLVETFKKNLNKKVQELEISTSEHSDRLAREVIFYADKVDVNEEIIRFRTHSTHFINVLNSSKSGVGKHLDFLLQEMLREINTIGSKSGAITISSKVVEVKTRLEKIREHIQNVE
jgi:uncharacterized protein (TIGR00255 family)